MYRSIVKPAKHTHKSLNIWIKPTKQKKIYSHPQKGPSTHACFNLESMDIIIKAAKNTHKSKYISKPYQTIYMVTFFTADIQLKMSPTPR